MMKDWDGILWPTLGNPAAVVVDSKEYSNLIVYICLSQKKTLRKFDIQAELTLIEDTYQSKKIPLRLVKIESVSLQESFSHGRWASWIIENSSNPHRLIFQVPFVSDFKSRRNSLFDLQVNIQGRIFKNVNAVFITPRSKDFRILIANDIHVASRWDEVEKNVKKLFPERNKYVFKSIGELAEFNYEDTWTQECILNSFVNPNKNFAYFIKEANRMFDKGEIDFIVIIGDIIDYKYRRFRFDSGSEYSDTELAFFEDMIMGKHPLSERIRVPVFITTGNHEYRLYPYKFQIYGLRHCGLADDVTIEYLKRNNEFLNIKYGCSDIDSVRINTGKNHSLNYYYRHFNPMDDFSLDLGGNHYIFMDTGSDSFCHLSKLFSSRGVHFIKGLFKSLESSGFYWRQISYFSNKIKSIPDNSALFLFCHAPFFNTSPDYYLPGNPDEEYPLPLKLKLNNPELVLRRKKRIAFEKLIDNHKVGFSALYQNQLPMLTSLVNRDGPSMIFSGHIHRLIEFGIDKKNGQLYYFNYSDSDNFEKFLSNRVLISLGNALGHVDRDYQEPAVPSYRIIHIHNNSIKTLKNVPLGAKPYNQMFSHIRTDHSAKSEIVTLIFKKNPKFDLAENFLLHRVVLQFLTRSGSILEKPIKDIPVEPYPKSSIISQLPLLDSQKQSYISYIVTDIPLIKLKIKNRPKDIKIAFIVESFLKTPEGFFSFGLTRHHRELKD